MQADVYHRAARPPYGRVPRHTSSGDRLRATARLLALVGVGGDPTLSVAALLASLLDLAVAVTELREAQQHAAQAAAARKAAEHLNIAHARARSRAAQPFWAARPEQGRGEPTPADVLRDFPEPIHQALLDAHPAASHRSGPSPTAGPTRRAGPSP